jgi:predicted transcriptional regulator of viral defense system
MGPSTKTDQVLKLARGGPVRARRLDELGIPRAYLSRLVERGQLEQVSRGIYQLAEAETTELHSVAQVAVRVPHAIICLLTALQIHGLTTELPHAVWIMIDTRARRPTLDALAIEVVRAHGASREHGVEVRKIEGVDVRITSSAKTVADCFRYRRHVGLDVAIAALRDYVAKGRGRSRAAREYTVDALIAAAKVDRVQRVMQPYLEAIV